MTSHSGSNFLKRKLVVIQEHSGATDALLFLLGQSNDYEVHTLCHDFDTAMDTIRQVKPNVVITDVQNAGSSVVSFIQRVVKMNAGVRILVLSDSDSERIIFDVLKAGADAFIYRPEGLNRIVEEVQKVDHGNNALSPRILNKVVSTLKISKDSPLTTRETQVLQLLVEGLTYILIAEQLHISSQTSRTHIKNIYKKLNVASRAQAVKFALTEKIV